MGQDQVLQTENPDWLSPTGVLSRLSFSSIVVRLRLLAAMEVRFARYPTLLGDVLPQHREAPVQLLQVFFCLVPSCEVLPD